VYFISFSPQPRSQQSAQTTHRTVDRAMQVRVGFFRSHLPEGQEIHADMAVVCVALPINVRQGHYDSLYAMAEPTQHKTQLTVGVIPEDIGKIDIPNL